MPDPERATITELEQIAKLSTVRLRHHIRRAEIKKDKKGTYDVNAVLNAVSEHRQENKNHGGQSEKMQGFRETEAELKIRERQIKLAELEGTVVRKSEVLAWISEQFAGLRQSLMSMPQSIAKRCEKKSASKIQKILTDELTRTLNRFARVHEVRSGQTVEPEEPAQKPKKPKRKSAKKRKGKKS